jgi:hypothetical protein
MLFFWRRFLHQFLVQNQGDQGSML